MRTKNVSIIIKCRSPDMNTKGSPDGTWGLRVACKRVIVDTKPSCCKSIKNCAFFAWERISTWHMVHNFALLNITVYCLFIIITVE